MSEEDFILFRVNSYIYGLMQLGAIVIGASSANIVRLLLKRKRQNISPVVRRIVIITICVTAVLWLFSGLLGFYGSVVREFSALVVFPFLLELVRNRKVKDLNSTGQP